MNKVKLGLFLLLVGAIAGSIPAILAFLGGYAHTDMTTTEKIIYPLAVLIEVSGMLLMVWDRPNDPSIMK